MYRKHGGTHKESHLGRPSESIEDVRVKMVNIDTAYKSSELSNEDLWTYNLYLLI